MKLEKMFYFISVNVNKTQHVLQIEKIIIAKYEYRII